MTPRPCNRALQPRSGWQCMDCLALNEAETEFEDRMCSACEMPEEELLVAEHDVEEEESPSCEADVESSVAATDAESVQDAE